MTNDRQTYDGRTTTFSEHEREFTFAENQPLLEFRPGVFTALHGMQTWSSDENSVCLSVRLSVTRVHCDKMVERSVKIYIPYERTSSLVF